MRSRRFVDRIEPAEDREVLPHREPHRHVDIGAFEIHPAQHIGALVRHRTAQHPDAPRSRQHQPHDHGDRRGLAGAIAAEQPGDAAARDAKRHVVDGAGGLVELDQMRDLDRGRPGSDRPRQARMLIAASFIMRAVPWAIGAVSARLRPEFAPSDAGPVRRICVGARAVKLVRRLRFRHSAAFRISSDAGSCCQRPFCPELRIRGCCDVSRTQESRAPA